MIVKPENGIPRHVLVLCATGAMQNWNSAETAAANSAFRVPAAIFTYKPHGFLV
jgi:hypothetical protein